jgi:hypothetical protein
MEANKKLNTALEAVYNSAEWQELQRVVMALRYEGCEMSATTERNLDHLAITAGWIYDQIKPVKRGKTKVQKIRKILGYYD